MGGANERPPTAESRAASAPPSEASKSSGSTLKEASVVVALGALALLAGGALVACFDLLHSTSDVLTACELDASRTGCSEPSENFCSYDPEQAREHATHACAWLGACEAPTGKNAFGACSFNARMAFDCAANPNHRSKRAAHDLWDCLQRVNSCAEVDACVFGDASTGPCGAPGVYSTCLGAANQSVVLSCADGGVKPYPMARGENCAMWGQTCEPTAGGATCGGEGPGSVCQSGCLNTALHWCPPSDDGGTGIDQGIDCSNNGAGVCDGFPSPGSPLWVACRTEGDAAACTPDLSATCDGGVAVMCPSGAVETLDCASLLGSAPACSAGALSPPFDWTSPCTLAPAACVNDSCDGDVLTGCEKGAAFSAKCATEGLGACRLLTADPGSAPRAACTPPAP